MYRIRRGFKKCRIGGMGKCGRKAVSRLCRDVARQQTCVKGHKKTLRLMPNVIKLRISYT